MAKVKVRGGGEYLPVADRILVFRDNHPNWCIVNNIEYFNEEMVVIRCAISDESGIIRATGYGECTPQGASNNEGRYIAIAETRAVGRALNFLGYSTDALLTEEGMEQRGVHWTEIEPWPKFWKWTTDKLGMTNEQVRDALAVDSVKDFQGTRDEALALLQEAAKEYRK